jgi:beta-glucosidase
MKTIKVLCLLLLTSSFVLAQNGVDTKMGSFINGLMSKMTLDEKIGQLN